MILKVNIKNKNWDIVDYFPECVKHIKQQDKLTIENMLFILGCDWANEKIGFYLANQIVTYVGYCDFNFYLRFE